MHKPISNNSIFRKICKKITDSCEHWFVKSFLKPVIVILPASVVTWGVSRSNLTKQLDGILDPKLIELLSQSALLVLIGTYLYLVVLKSIYSFIKHYSKPEREINRDDILGLLYTINEVVGDKMKRFSDLAITPINRHNIFFEITKPDQQINLLMAALKATFEHIDQTNSFIRVGLLTVKNNKPHEWACFFPAERPPRTSPSELSQPTSTVMCSIKAKAPVLVEDITKELKIKSKDKRRYIKFNTQEGEDGSQLCYPITHPATKNIEYVITITGNTKLFLEEKHLPLYTWLIDHFAMRVSLEHSLLIIKEKADGSK